MSEAVSSSEIDQAFLRRAIRLAMNGRGAVEPNPMVGCVIAKNGHVIGEGYHARFGGPHAEPTALAACTDSPAGATAYVTLEPCCHLNKKTPPCAPRLIDAKIARVVVGCLDPNPDVNGKGLAMLRAAGIQVDGPVLEAEAKQLIAPFLAHVRHSRPYVTLKSAQSADGKVAGPGGRRMQISNAASTHLVHLLRSRSDVIMVGIGTVIADDPLLTARGVDPPQFFRQASTAGPPVLTQRRQTRVVLDARGRMPLNSKLVLSAMVDPSAVVRVFCAGTPADSCLDLDYGRRLREQGVAVTHVAAGSRGRLPLGQVLQHLHKATHVLVEAGPTLADGFFEAGLVDRLWIFRSPRRIDDRTAPFAANVPAHFVVTGEMDVDGDRLTEYLNPTSDVFFAPVPSADFVMSAHE